MRFSRVLLAVIATILVFVIPRSAYASVAFDLVPPDGQLTRGQDVQFIIDIDTQGGTVTNTSVELTYDTTYLRYKSATPGDAMTALNVTQQGTNALILSGSNPSGYSGSGTFAYVTFTLIATAPGATELCTLTVPNVTNTPAPTAPPVNPTQLPVTGQAVDTYRAAAVGGLLLASSIGLYLWYNRSKYESKPGARKKHA